MQKRIPHRGIILLVGLVFLGVFVTISTALLSYFVSYSHSVKNATETSQALALAEAGIDKAGYELNQNSAYSGENNTALGAGVFTVVVTNIDSNTKKLTATGYIPNATNPSTTKTIKVTIGVNPSSASFHYGIQSGNGGFSLNNTSGVVGNVYSGGSIIGANSSQNTITGDVISAGASGLVYGIHVLGSAYAHTLGSLSGSTIVEGQGYFQTLLNTVIVGVPHPNSPDQGVVPLPISDTQINEWEVDAAAGGTATCTNGSYTINSDVSIGPLKIPCNLNIVGTGGGITVTLSGHVWVTGNISFSNKVTLKVDPSLGSVNPIMVADNPDDTTGSGTISIGQSATFQGSGAAGSYVFLISQNHSAEQGGSTAAISMNQGASAVVAYASHGLISVNQSANVKEVTAYKIALYQSASVTYDSGLGNSLFQSGPGASWTITPGTYAISP